MDYAEQFIDDCYSDSLKDLPEFIRFHIDYEGIGRDMELGGEPADSTRLQCVVANRLVSAGVEFVSVLSGISHQSCST